MEGIHFSRVDAFIGRPLGEGRLLVVKLGGSVLTGTENIRRSAKLLGDAVRAGDSVVAVVSAMSGVTDGLLRDASAVNGDTPPELLAEIATMGERISARLFAAALSAEGLRPKVVDPQDSSWPIVAEGDPMDARVLLDESRRRAVDTIGGLLEEGYTPVVCGFIGKDRDGRIVALGRGGSDTTAVVLASSLGADEVVLVKDVGGVMSGDPKRTGGAVPVEGLDREEVLLLSAGGSKLIHDKAFAYLGDGVRMRVTSLEEGLSGGTLIEDSTDPQMGSGSNDGVQVRVDEGPMSMITVVGAGARDNVHLLVEAARSAGASVALLSVTEKAALLYVEGGEGVYGAVHAAAVGDGAGKAVSAFDGLSMITVKGRALEVTPGYIAKAVEPLARAGINVYGIYTAANSIGLFVRAGAAREAERLIRGSLGGGTA